MPGEASYQINLLGALDRGECRTVEHLAALTGLSNKYVVMAASRLIVRGYATRAERGCFTLTEEGEAARDAGTPLKSGPRGKLTARLRRPRRRTIRDRIWNALRIRGKASVPELQELVSNDGETASTTNIQHYVRALVRAGYVRTLSRRDPGTALTSNGFKRYQLMKDTGPLTPQVRTNSKTLYDPNTKETFNLGGAS